MVCVYWLFCVFNKTFVLDKISSRFDKKSKMYQTEKLPTTNSNETLWLRAPTLRTCQLPFPTVSHRVYILTFISLYICSTGLQRSFHFISFHNFHHFIDIFALAAIHMYSPPLPTVYVQIYPSAVGYHRTHIFFTFHRSMCAMFSFYSI